MSRIPFGQVQGDVVSIGAPPLASLDAAAANSIGSTLQGVGDALNVGRAVLEHQREARNTVNVSNELVGAQQELDKLRTDLEQDPDTKTREKRFAARAAEVKSQAAQRLGDSRAVQSFAVRFNQLSGAMQVDVRHRALGEERQQFQVDLFDNLDKLATQAVFARNPLERQALQAEADKAITDAVRTGRMTAIQANGASKAYLGKVDAALAGELVRQNPAAAIAALGDPAQFTRLDAATRVQLRSQAEQRQRSLGVEARAELRADMGEFLGDLQRSASGGPMPARQDYEALVRRAGGPKSAEGVRLTRAWEFYTQVNTESDGKTIPELQASVTRLNRGTRPPGEENLTAAQADMNLTPQETALYRRHLGNVVGPGGVDRPDGKRSTLSTITAEIDGRTYVLPTVWDGQALSADAAVDRARASGLDQFPSYATEAEARLRYERLHSYIEKDQPSATPRDLHAARVLQAALARKTADRDRDPATYALKQYPTIAEQLALADRMETSGDEMQKQAAPDVRRRAWQAVLDAQTREGVAPHNLQLLPNDGAEALRAKFLTTEGQARVDLVDQLRSQFGDHWSRVVAQVWKGKPAPWDVQVLAAIPMQPGAGDLPRVEIAEAAKISDQQAGEVLGKRVTAIGEATRTALAQMLPTMANAPDGPGFIATYQHAAERLARLYAMRGMSDDEAATKAASRVFFDHFEVVDTVRIPKVGGEPIVPASAVRQAQRLVIGALPKADIEVPAGAPGTTEAQRKEMLVRAVKSGGYWMTTADDKGMVLMAGPGLPVRWLGGEPVVLPFESVTAGGQQADAATNLERKISQRRQGYHPLPDLGSDPAPDAAGSVLPQWLLDMMARARPPGAYTRNRMERTGPLP